MKSLRTRAVLVPLLITLLTGAVLLLAQSSTLPLSSLRRVSATGVLAHTPGAGWHLAVLDPAGFQLDTSTTPPTIRAVPVVTAITEKTVLVTPVGEQITMTIPDAGYVPASLHVYRNGLLLVAPNDYTVSGVTVNLVELQYLVAGDVAQLRYRLP
jgi:hypothetical protein